MALGTLFLLGQCGPVSADMNIQSEEVSQDTGEPRVFLSTQECVGTGSACGMPQGPSVVL